MADGVAMRGVVKRFGAREVLRSVDLDLAPGSMTAVLGPSGCGKTTLLRIIAGFTEADSGEVSIDGRSVAGMPVHSRRVGLLPQEGALFPYLDVAGNVAFGLPRRLRRVADAEIARWLDVVGLSGYARARPDELSGGQQQRVALARALAARPKVILLDEPFAALDAGLRRRVREDIAAILVDVGTTAVLVTHDQDEALSLAESVALLLDGEVVQHASPKRIYEQPATLAAARFVGATVELTGHVRGGRVTSALGNHALRGTGPGDGAATVVVRPEQVRLVSDGVRGRVTAVRYFGAESSVSVLLEDGADVTLRTPGAEAVVNGQQVSVAADGPVLAYGRSPT